MTEQTTTTIETLTAEVRALMIGKRQVTLSVYRQLDTIPWADIEPFGRVRDKQDDDPGIYVVGRHRTTGVLSRASIHRNSWVVDAPPAFVHWAYHRDIVERHRLHEITESHGRKLHWVVKHEPRSSYSIIGLKCDALRNQSLDRDARHAGEYCDMDALEGQWLALAEQQVDKLIPHELEYQAAELLPLIVLAGLR
ncbi:hypothetical protein ACFYRW_10130 [Rhodococcus pyridinivorans]|uniref:hypothetical protein n=1 Tax=Rhodococcus pyridinivorans TaxID=103816 RepID=UPI003689EE2B